MFGRNRLVPWVLLAALSLLLIAAIPASSGEPAPWWRFHGDDTSTGYAPTGDVLVKQLSWSFDTGDGVESSCAVLDGRLYVANNAGTLFCLDALEGTQIWNVSLCPTRGIESSPAVYDGVVLIGDGEGVLHALDAANGTRLWNFTTGGEIKSSPNVDGMRVYFSSYDNKVYCLDLQGEHRWNYTANGYIHTSVTLYDGLAYIGSCDTNLYALDMYDGSVKWNFSADYFPSTPAARGDLVYAGSFDQNIYCLDHEKGTMNWKYLTDFGIFSSPAVDGESVVVGSGPDLYSLNAYTGELNFKFETGGDVDSSPVLTDKYVLFGSVDKHIYCVNKKTGREEWRFKTEAPVVASPAIYASNVYIGSRDGFIYCLGLTEDIIPPRAWLKDPVGNVTIDEKFVVQGSAWDDKNLERVWISYDNTSFEPVETYDSYQNWNFSLNTSSFKKGTQTIWLKVSDGHHNVTTNHTFNVREPEEDGGVPSFFIYLIFSAILLLVVVGALFYTQLKDKKK